MPGPQTVFNILSAMATCSVNTWPTHSHHISTMLSTRTLASHGAKYDLIQRTLSCSSSSYNTPSSMVSISVAGGADLATNQA